MPMEVEFVNMGPEHIEVDSADVSPADLINGRGEEIAETPTVELTGTVGSEEGIAIDHTINQEDDDEQTSTLDESMREEELDIISQKLRAEWEHADEIAAAKQDHTAAALARAAAEDAFKAAKSHEKACLATLSALIARGPSYPKPASINQGGGDNDSAIDQAVRNDKSSPAIPLDDPNSDQSWRAIPIAPMLDGIKGMGAKKREAILELTPTLGDFEDLRGKASQAHKELREVMPKGIGAAMCDEIEERAMSAMRKHQLSLEKVKQANQEAVAPADPDADEPADDAEGLDAELDLVESDQLPDAYDDGLEYEDADSGLDADIYSDADAEG